MFAQFDVSFSDVYLLHQTQFFFYYHIWNNYKIGPHFPRGLDTAKWFM